MGPVLRAVVDTNVWISAALSQAGAPALVVRRLLAHGVPIFTHATFAELESRLWLPKFDRYLSIEIRNRILHDLGAAAHWAEVPATIANQRFSRDADDDKFIHAAMSAQAPWLISGDRDLLDVPPPVGLRILTPAEALELDPFRP